MTVGQDASGFQNEKLIAPIVTWRVLGINGHGYHGTSGPYRSTHPWSECNMGSSDYLDKPRCTQFRYGVERKGYQEGCPR